MHIPDGFLEPKVAVGAALLAGAGVALAAYESRSTSAPRRVPLLGVTAAFLFAAQMLNFPVVGGTSGHLVGGVLAAVLVGPHNAVLVLTSVLVVQCLVFGDGGLLALGANIFNMGLVHPLVGYLALRLFAGRAPSATRRIFAAGSAAWCATLAAAFACSGELVLSRVVSPLVVFPAMLGVHMLIGVGESLITMLVIAAVERARPEVLEQVPPKRALKGLVAFGLSISVALALFAAAFASPWPDGLEKVAASLGLEEKTFRFSVPALLADYRVPGLSSTLQAVAIAGSLGAVLVFAASWSVARVLVRRSPELEEPAGNERHPLP